MSELNSAATVFSICVPTFNRGKKALSLVKEALPKLEIGWELIIIDNCSTSECAEYEEIGRMAQASQGKLTYIHNASNVGFHNNYVKCMRYPRGDLAMVVSDEDRPNIPMIPIALKLVKERPSIGIIRGGVTQPESGGIRKNSFKLHDAIFPAGKTALMSYGVMNNYFSGVIYNIKLLSSLGLVDRLEKKIMIHQAYPHLYVEGLACALIDVAISSETACFEGPAQFVGDDPDAYCPPYSFGARLDQFVLLRDCLYEAVELTGSPFNAELFANLYLAHVAKYLRLVGAANASLYAKHNIDVKVAVRAFSYFACAAVVGFKELGPYLESLLQEIDKLARKFGG